MPWTPNPENARRNRQRWLAKHYPRAAEAHPVQSRGGIDDFLPARQASWYANELLPLLQDLKEEGYTLESRADVAELLDQRAEYTAASYVRDQIKDQEWSEFLDMTSLAARVPTTPVREIAERAEAFGLNVANLWDSEDRQGGKVEFNNDVAKVNEFVGVLRREYPGRVFSVTTSRYNVPILWVSNQGMTATAANADWQMQTVKEMMDANGASDLDPRHVMAYVNVGLENRQDGLLLSDMSTSQIEAEVLVSIEAVREDPAQAEKVAQSYGL